MKRGQATLFIVLGLVVVAVFLLMYFIKTGLISDIKKEGFSKAVGWGSDKDEVRGYVEECITNIGNDALLLVGLQGGRINPEKYLNYMNLRISYGYYEGKNVLISKAETENEIGGYYRYFLPLCIDNIKGHALNQGNLSVKMDIGENITNVFIRIPIDILKKDSKIAVEPAYSTNFNVRLGRIMNVANNLVLETSKNENVLNMEYVFNIGKEFYINIVPINEDIVYMITDSKYMLNNMNYTFMFAEKSKGEI